MTRNCELIALESPTICNADDFHFINEDSTLEFNHFWSHLYLIRLGRFGNQYLISANCEQDAIDFLIDFLEEVDSGFLMSEEDVTEEDFLDDYICGGNHSRYLNTHNIRIDRVNLAIQTV